MKHVKSERLKKLEVELSDLEQWLKLATSSLFSIKGLSPSERCSTNASNQLYLTTSDGNIPTCFLNASENFPGESYPKLYAISFMETLFSFKICLAKSI